MIQPTISWKTGGSLPRFIVSYNKRFKNVENFINQSAKSPGSYATFLYNTRPYVVIYLGTF
jgi:hypothetical protein